MKREALLVLPHADNDGNPLDEVSEQVQLELARVFDGVTVTEGAGKWFDPETGKLYAEPVHLLTTAYEPTAANDTTFRYIAYGMGLAAKQLAVYLRYSSGDVETIKITENQLKAA